MTIVQAFISSQLNYCNSLLCGVTDALDQQWSPLNRFRTEQGHCGACRRKWRLTDTDLCPCDETQMMSHIVESCSLTKLNGSLSRLHSADEDAVSWLTSYGSWHAYDKKKQGDHLSGKPGNVREFDSCRGKSGILLKIRELSGEKSCQGKLPKTVYCKLHISVHTGIQ